MIHWTKTQSVTRTESVCRQWSENEWLEPSKGGDSQSISTEFDCANVQQHCAARNKSSNLVTLWTNSWKCLWHRHSVNEYQFCPLPTEPPLGMRNPPPPQWCVAEWGQQHLQHGEGVTPDLHAQITQ